MQADTKRPDPARPQRTLVRRGSYLTIRVTGVLLAVLVLGHYALTHIVTDVAETDAGFVARRWSSVTWVVWDALMLGTTLLHALAGMATVVRDHRPAPASRRRWLAGVAGVVAILLILGLATITFSVIDR